ncbi:hypothetical protein ElyMa_002591700 [Elysia marginata]|uniref:Uncharacterized protein n=1 Tax=Elysia marginata TaxID=1093978 RepID=A0AAV4H0X9_9GAST|nr:hypothetical protein ElyMa_002591700 [Elysia marginata]
MLYVALSRTGDRESIHYLAPNGLTRNVVYTEVLFRFAGDWGNVANFLDLVASSSSGRRSAFGPRSPGFEPWFRRVDVQSLRNAIYSQFSASLMR